MEIYEWIILAITVLPIIGLLSKNIIDVLNEMKKAIKDGIITKKEVDDVISKGGIVLRTLLKLARFK